MTDGLKATSEALCFSRRLPNANDSNVGWGVGPTVISVMGRKLFVVMKGTARYGTSMDRATRYSASFMLFQHTTPFLLFAKSRMLERGSERREAEHQRGCGT